MKKYSRALSIAGSDSGGGAGIQADLKTFSALGCFGTTVITALTAQNTLGVKSIHNVEASFVAEQFSAVMEDIGTDAMKIGMLHRTEIIQVLAQKIRECPTIPLVLDPVILSTSGHPLLEPQALRLLKEEFIPLTWVLTPNLPEASLLLNRPLDSLASPAEIEKAALAFLNLGAKAVVIKGGHASGSMSNDYAALREDEDKIKSFWLNSKRIETANTHGTGCTFSAAITAFLAKGFSLEQSIRAAKDYLTQAIQKGALYKLGKGHGPVHHFHQNFHQNWD